MDVRTLRRRSAPGGRRGAAGCLSWGVRIEWEVGDDTTEAGKDMSDTQNVAPASSPRTGRAAREPLEPTGWVGWVVFAGIMMIMMGAFQAMTGFVALFNSDYYLVGQNGLVVSVDYTAWGWVHLIVGGLAVIAGLGIIAGQTWARVVGIILAVVAALVNMTFLAAYPVWMTILIAVDVIVIYALAVHGREVRAYRG